MARPKKNLSSISDPCRETIFKEVLDFILKEESDSYSGSAVLRLARLKMFLRGQQFKL